jgi:hypothetical protein
MSNLPDPQKLPSKIIPTDNWDEETRKVVGEIAISFAQLEHVLWLSPKRVKQLRFPEWDQIAGRVSIEGRCKQIADAYAMRKMNQAKEAELGRLLKEVAAANEERNSVIHARWGCKKRDGKMVARYRVWRNKNLGVDHGELAAIRDKIRNLRDRLGQYRW